MKKIFNIFLLTAAITLVISCDKGFDELNMSKTGATSLDPTLILNNAIINSSPQAGTLQYELGIVQQIITSNTGVNLGANWNQVNVNATPAVWTTFFQNGIKYTSDVINRTKEDPIRVNLYNMARIIRAYDYMIITDTYGDIPYSEGGQGYSKQVFFPKYDAQQAIYTDLIAEFTAATAALDPAAKIETSDVLYAGDIAKWKKFGNSLLLRAGMRLVNANPAAAQAAVTAAFASTGGLITTNADNAVNRHDANFINPVGNTLNGTEAANFYLAAPFVDMLKTSNDPRLRAISVRYPGSTNGGVQGPATANTVPANQFGMPMGSTDATADAQGALLIGGGNRYAFSQVDRNRMAKRTSPLYLVTASQTNLLLAEAAMRTWVAGGTVGAQTYFANGIRAHMDQLAAFDPGSAVPAVDRDVYVTANPLNVSTVPAAMAQIHYQYWISSFLQGNEAWANFRRTGFPALLVNPYSGKTVNWITRLTYPPSEGLVNGANVAAAITAQGGDNLDTKVWWNK